MSRFARSYAEAFLQTLPSGYEVELFLERAGAIRRALQGDSRLKAFFGAPAVPAGAKRKALEALADRSGLDPFGRRFLQLVLENGRVLQLSEILSAVRDAYDLRRGVVAARVKVAHPLGEVEAQSIEEALSRQVGRRVRMQVEVDPKILGGFIARVGSEVFDASAAGEIERFQENVKETAEAG